MPSMLKSTCTLTPDPRSVPAAVQTHLPWQFSSFAAGHVRALGEAGFGIGPGGLRACRVEVLLNSPDSG